ncbi:bestrophin-4-like [Centruroides sculpturatus]|uniref:bestrophin-4-like n=1 Tax=Centruroides sculpturatus TaxID=218467 RepID=UPI000C6D06CC|nr:bestrophin-4-like [Centruroides sculpturatus]
MTITYQFNVATSSFLGFAKLLVKWRGSVYKLIYKELLVYATAYAAISITYRNFMSESQRSLIPLSFVLGFYVTFVVTRWWNQFTTIPWPDRILHTIVVYISGSDERGRLLRRTLMRYVNLSFVLVFQAISGAVKKRFPTVKHLVEAGFMTTEERELFESVPTKVNKHWVPIIWFINLLSLTCKEGRVHEGAPLKHILEEINEFRSKTSLLWCYDWVTVPLVYTQVVTLTTHLFFLTCLIGRQYLDPAQRSPGQDIDLYFPFFTFLQFFFFMGWLKVAEQLINPFGEDDDDFETNWLIDRHIQVSYLAVDELYAKLPRIEKDIYWDHQEPELPYTEAALVHKIPTYRGSTMHMVIPREEQIMVFGDEHKHFSSSTTLTSALARCCIRNIWSRSSGRETPDERDLTRGLNPNKLIAHRNIKEIKHSAKTLGSNTSLFEETYLRILNRGVGKDSSFNKYSMDTIYNISGTDAATIAAPAGVLLTRRQMPCQDTRPPLARLPEVSQESLPSDIDSISFTVYSSTNSPSILNTQINNKVHVYCDSDSD